MSFLNIGQKFEKVMGKEQEFLDAARTGNLTALEKLLSNKAKKSTAAGGGFGHRIDKLSSYFKSVNVNCTDKNGYTALHHAAVNGHRDVVEALLRYEAQPGLQDNQGCTPVHLAAWNGNPEIVLQLLTAGTDAEPGVGITPVHVNQQNGNGDTALHSAAQYGHVAVLDVLLQKDANPTIRNLDEESPLDLAAQYGRLEVVQLLLIKHPDLSHRPPSTQSPLHLASRNGHRDIVEVLLDNHFDLNTATESGTCLHEAALHGKLEVVRLLLDRGINVSARDQKGQTVLELLSEHQSQQRTFTEITQAIKDHMTRPDSNHSDVGLYESLSRCTSGSFGDKPTAAVKPLPPEKPPVADKSTVKTPEKPVPASRQSMIRTSPAQSPDEPSPLYAKPNKEISETDDRVVSVASSVGDPVPPPLPPRSSIFQDKPARSSSYHDKALGQQPTVLEAGSPDKGSPGTNPKSTMVVPKKPPRMKKSPAPVRRSTSTEECPSPDSLPTNTIFPSKPSTDNSSLSSKPNTDNTSLPRRPSTDNNSLPIRPSTESIPDKTSSIPKIEVVTSDNTDSVISSQHSLKHSQKQMDQDAEIKTKMPESKAHSSHARPPLSPKPVIPPRVAASISPGDNSIDPQTGKQVFQEFYMEMKQVQPVEPIKQVVDLKPEGNTDLSSKPDDTNVDNYGILFPQFKNSSPDKSRKFKKPEFKRTNTAPEENLYVGHNPKSPVSSFKEKQIKRANTAPDESSLYTSMSGSGNEPPPPKHEPFKENEYAEIPEKSPTSPKENIYSTITDTKKVLESQTSIYSEISDLSPPVSPNDKGDHSEPTAEKDDENNFVTDESKVECDTKESSKPNYLDFIKRKSTGPLTPTGYPQPPTPDFPPPSPATAMMGIELKIQEMDAKRKSRDITTLTDTDTLASIQEHGQSPEVKDTAESVSVSSTVNQEDNKVEIKSKQSEVKVSTDVRVQSEVSISLEVSKVTAAELSQTGSSESEKVSKDCQKSVIQSPITKDIPKSSISNISVIETKSGDKMPVSEDEMQGNHTQSDKTVEKQSGGDIAAAKSSDTKNSQLLGAESGDSKTSLSVGAASPVMMRRKESVHDPDMDQFKGLLRGSTIGAPRKVVSQFYEDVLRKNQAGNRKSVPASALTFDPLMEKEEEIDIDQVMKSIDVEVEKRASGMMGHESSLDDDSEEWAKIQDIMASFGGGIARESVFIRDLEPAFTKLLAGSQMMSVGEWLESIGMEQYENAFIANGFDNVDFLDCKVMEEQDLEQIGVLNYDHRQQLLQAAIHLPQLEPIDKNSPPVSVEQWLMSLQMLDYLDTFTSHGYNTMEKVESILWELQLRTVLDISMLGHRKRILASLGERHPPDRQNTKKRSISSLSPEENKSPFNDINLFKDYSNVKPTSSSEEDIKESTQMAVDSSEDEDVFKKTGGQSIRNSDIHLRPPHLAQTCSPARQWRHKPEMLIKGCCNYTAQYLGSTMVSNLTGGTHSTRAGITKLKKSTDVLAKVPIIMLSISFKGVKFIDAKSKKVICDHEIGNIFCACQDTDNLNFFAYITRDIETGHHYCHVFSVKSSSLAHDIILTLGESFEVAYQMAMKDKSMVEAMELDRKMSQSDAEDTYSVSSKMSTNTV